MLGFGLGLLDRGKGVFCVAGSDQQWLFIGVSSEGGGHFLPEFVIEVLFSEVFHHFGALIDDLGRGRPVIVGYPLVVVLHGAEH